MSVKKGLLLCGIAWLLLPVAAEDCTDSSTCGACTQFRFTDSTKTTVSCESCSFLRVAIQDKTMRVTSVSSTNKMGDFLCNSALMWVVVVGLIVLGLCCLCCAVWLLVFKPFKVHAAAKKSGEGSTFNARPEEPSVEVDHVVVQQQHHYYQQQASHSFEAEQQKGPEVAPVYYYANEPNYSMNQNLY